MLGLGKALPPGRTRTAVAVLAGGLGAAAAAFATRLLQARVLDPDEVGRLSLAISWASAIGGIASLGLASAAAQRIARERALGGEEAARRTGRFALALAAGTGVAAALALSGPGAVIAAWAGRPLLRQALWAAVPVALVLPLAMAAVGVARGWGDARSRVLLRDLAGGALRLAGVVVAYLATRPQPSSVALVAGYGAGSLVSEAVFSWFVGRRYLASGPGSSPPPGGMSIAARLRELRPFAAAALLQQVVWNGDLLVLGAVAPAAAVGMYAVARGTERMLEIASEAAAYRFLPEASALAASSGPGSLARVFFATRRLVLGLLAPGLAVCLFAPREALQGLFGAPYGDAAGPLRLLVLGLVVSVAAGYNDRALVASGAAADVTRGLLLGAGSGLLVALVAASRWGAMGAAAGWCTMVLAQNLWWSHRLRRLAPALHPRGGGLAVQAAVALLPAGLAGAAVRAAGGDGLAIVLAVLTAGGLAGLVLITRPGWVGDRQPAPPAGAPAGGEDRR